MDSSKIDSFSMHSSSSFPDSDAVATRRHHMIARWVAGLSKPKTQSICYGLFAKVQSIEVLTLTASGARELRCKGRHQVSELRSKVRWSEAWLATANWLRLL
ncbi:hypothetical protein M9H77_23566 [Catharanthus roseus]|uniref:Uncharacterized protein n=1 Tax=Catharanthus roseus TaxID=4058 RepID=A0ACC0ATD8_CATRO|nr:hypothetical protein M9H77_23566 [Catharanthus roseus]